jgi:3-isopropylmalate/(R)-2-methylmalate dehydratase small subunit
VTKIAGKVWKYGDNVDTDVIIPANYCLSNDPSFLGQHAMEGIDPQFVKKVKPGDLIVAGENFGCGSSREQAPLALKGAGVGAIIAKSFARIFYRNAINIALPIVISPEAAAEISEGNEVEVDLATGVIRDNTTGRVYESTPFPPFVQDIIRAGGLVNYIRQRRGSKGS